MATGKEPQGRAPETVPEFREVVVSLADDLATRGLEAEAEILRRAGDVRSTPPDELLAMREALVVTRPIWEPLEDLRSGALAALGAAKRLAISL